MSLVPETYYNHEEFGRVELVDVRPDDIVCVRTDDDRFVFEGVANFRDAAEPAPMTISAPATTVGAATPDPT